jgi:hypothetical protein
MCCVGPQLELAAGQGNAEKQREYLWRVADCYDKSGHLDTADKHLKELLAMNLSQEQKLEALCFLADIQVLWGALLLPWAGSTNSQAGSALLSSLLQRFSALIWISGQHACTCLPQCDAGRMMMLTGGAHVDSMEGWNEQPGPTMLAVSRLTQQGF